MCVCDVNRERVFSRFTRDSACVCVLTYVTAAVFHFPSEDATEDDVKALICEMELLSSIGPHPNIVSLVRVCTVGSERRTHTHTHTQSYLHTHKHASSFHARVSLCCFSPEPIYMVMEYMCHGDLLGFMRASRGHHGLYTVSPGTRYQPPSLTLSSRDLLNVASKIAKGMRFLADRKVRVCSI